MKFHRVKLENLNSLYGEQIIDFEDHIRNSPLFLIIGPTGAGKSTILDAVCLALFGETPRLERKVGRAETDVAHIMSIGTASAHAEVEFSVMQSDGTRERYLASWSARRAYDDPEGSVQRPERGLYRVFEDGSMRLVVSDHREKYYQGAFDEALNGLSVDDFKRSILLAQGEFSAFLHASDSEKASILERLTSTDQYRRIGERASRRRRTVEDRHQKLMTRLEEMQILTEPQVEELAEAIEETEEKLGAIRTRLQQATTAADWLRKKERLQNRAESAEKALADVQKRREERSDDYQRLERDAELQDVEPAYREVVREQKTLGEAREALGPLDEEIEERTEKAEAFGEAVEAAEKKLTTAGDALKKAEPDLRRAHELRTKLDAATREVESSREELEQRNEAKTALVEQRDDLKSDLKKADETVENTAKQRDELESSRPLLQRLGSLRTRWTEAIAPLSEGIEALEAERKKLKASLKENQKERSKFDDDLKEARKQRSNWQGQVTRSQNRVDEVLGDFDDLATALETLSARLHEQSTRAEALREAKYVLQRIAEAERERDEVWERLESLREEVAALAEEQTKIKELETSRRQLVRQCEESLRQNERLLALSSYRRELDSGEPCPLCGSPVHPYCDSDELEEVDEQATTDRERLEKELEEAREALVATNTDVQRMANKFVARNTQLHNDETRLVAVKSTLEEEHAAFSKSAEKAGYSPLETFQLKSADTVAEKLAEATEGATETRARLDSIEHARRQLDRAQEKLDEAEKQRQEIELQTESLDQAADALRGRIETADEELEKRLDQFETRRSELLDELGEFGVDVEENRDVETALEAAKARRDAVQDADEAWEEAKKARKSLQTKLAGVDERIEEATGTVEKAEKALKTRADVVAKLKEEIAECLDGEDPAEVRKQLETTVREVRKAAEDAREVRSENSEKLSTARARRKDLMQRRDRAEVALKKAEKKLDETLARYDLDREQLEEHLLDPKTRKELRAGLRKLDEEQTRASTRVEDSSKQLEEHLEAAPDGTEDGLEPAVELQESLADRVNDVTRELGALQERWKKHEETRSRREELSGEIAEVQHELDVWNTIYGLIGVRDGERFKLFAQSLNLQGLVERANHRLEKLHPRYRLRVARGEGGEPTLSFMVQDRYQANVERPLTTLSGGETFLVSLALALGLADFRRVDMPIETLLLDEGFGTLDQDSLHMALTTLHQLHRDQTRQIGIISHVDALKELIDTRIVVEPVGHGRSQIRFEFGATDGPSGLHVVEA